MRGSQSCGALKYFTLQWQKLRLFEPIAKFVGQDLIMIAHRHHQTFHFGQSRKAHRDIRVLRQMTFELWRVEHVLFNKVDDDARIQISLHPIYSHELRASSICASISSTLGFAASGKRLARKNSSKAAALPLAEVTGSVSSSNVTSTRLDVVTGKRSSRRIFPFRSITASTVCNMVFNFSSASNFNRFHLDFHTRRAQRE